MKRVILSSLCLLALSSMNAQNYVTFKSNVKNKTSIKAEGLKITFADDKLIAVNGGSECVVPVSELSKFYFSDYRVGDVNHDDAISMADANKVTNGYVSDSTSELDFDTADVSGDEVITMADANSIVNIFVNE